MRRSAAALLNSSLIRAPRPARSSAVVAAFHCHIGDWRALCGIELWGCALAIERSLLLLTNRAGTGCRSSQSLRIWLRKSRWSDEHLRYPRRVRGHEDSSSRRVLRRVELSRSAPSDKLHGSSLTSASGHEFLGGSLYAWEAGVEMIRKVRLPRPRRLHQHSQVQTDGLATRNAA